MMEWYSSIHLQQTVCSKLSNACLQQNVSITSPLSHVIIVPAPFKWATPVPIPYWANCIRIENKNWTNTKIMIRADRTHVVDIEVDHHGPGKKCPKSCHLRSAHPSCRGRLHHTWLSWKASPFSIGAFVFEKNNWLNSKWNWVQATSPRFSSDWMCWVNNTI